MINFDSASYDGYSNDFEYANIDSVERRKKEKLIPKYELEIKKDTIPRQKQIDLDFRIKKIKDESAKLNEDY